MEENKILETIQYLLEPSVASGITALGLSAVILLVATLSYGTHSGVIYNFLFGPGSSLQLIQTSRGTLASISNTVFGNPLLNKILYFVFWMLIGLCAYVIMHAVVLGASGAAEDLAESRYVNIKRDETRRSLVTRLIIRALIIAAWITYIVFFIRIFLPFSILAAQIGLTLLPGFSGWVYGLVGLLVLLVGMHINVVFLRLSVLRARLFDSPDSSEPTSHESISPRESDQNE